MSDPCTKKQKTSVIDTSSLNLKLKPKSGTVPRMWRNTGKRGGEYQTNVRGVSWFKQTSKWVVEHISAETNEREFLGRFDTWEEACVKRALVTDGTPKKRSRLSSPWSGLCRHLQQL